MAKEKEPQQSEGTGRPIEGATGTTRQALRQQYEVATRAISRKKGEVTMRQVQNWINAAREAGISDAVLEQQMREWNELGIQIDERLRAMMGEFLASFDAALQDRPERQPRHGVTEGTYHDDE